MSHRIEQVNSLIQRDLGTIISRTLEFPSGSFVSVGQVKTSPNLKSAEVLVTITPKEMSEQVFEYLQKKTGFLQRELAKGLTMKFSPRIEFKIDKGGAQASRIEDLLDEIAEEDARYKKQ